MEVMAQSFVSSSMTKNRVNHVYIALYAFHKIMILFKHTYTKKEICSSTASILSTVSNLLGLLFWSQRIDRRVKHRHQRLQSSPENPCKGSSN